MYDPFAYDRFRFEQAQRDRRLARPRVSRRAARLSYRRHGDDVAAQPRPTVEPCFD